MHLRHASADVGDNALPGGHRWLIRSAIALDASRPVVHDGGAAFHPDYVEKATKTASLAGIERLAILRKEDTQALDAIITACLREAPWLSWIGLQQPRGEDHLDRLGDDGWLTIAPDDVTVKRHSREQ
jgi:hypothetical protein